jgi:hypothetical protein
MDLGSSDSESDGYSSQSPVRGSNNSSAKSSSVDEQPNQPMRIDYDLIVKIITNMFHRIKELPSQLKENDANYYLKNIYKEEWQIYIEKFYQDIRNFSLSTNNLISIIHPIHGNWLLMGDKIFDMLMDQDPDDDFLNIVTTICSLLSLILGFMNEYLMTSHHIMPSWCILSGKSITNIPMEIAMFYEICRVRMINNVFVNFLRHINSKMTVKSSGMADIPILIAFNVLPPMFSRWRKPGTNNNYSKVEMQVCHYSMKQVDESLEYLFHQINHLGYHSTLMLYIDELFNRVSWLVNSPYNEVILNMPEGRSRFDAALANDVSNFVETIEIKESGEVFSNNIDIANSIKSINEKEGLYMCNSNFIYRSILRYNVILRKSMIRNQIFKVTRILDTSSEHKDLSSWLRKWVDLKFEEVFVTMKQEVSNVYAKLLIPPSDDSWTNYRFPQQYISENSVWTLLYPSLKSHMSTIAGTDIRKIYYTPEPHNGTIYEHIVLRIVSMVFSSNKMDFLEGFTVSEENILRDLYKLKKERKMPILVQSFNRYCVLFRKNGEEHLYEHENIFDAISFLITIMIYDFNSNNITFTMIGIMKKGKSDVLKNDEKIALNNIAVSKKEKEKEEDLIDYNDNSNNASFF